MHTPLCILVTHPQTHAEGDLNMTSLECRHKWQQGRIHTDQIIISLFSGQAYSFFMICYLRLVSPHKESYVIRGLIKITGIIRQQYTEHWSVDLCETRECGWEEMAAELLLRCFRLSINDTSRVSLKLALSSQSVSLDHAVVRHCIIHAALLVSMISLGWNPDIYLLHKIKCKLYRAYMHMNWKYKQITVQPWASWKCYMLLKPVMFHISLALCFINFFETCGSLHT